MNPQRASESHKGAFESRKRALTFEFKIFRSTPKLPTKVKGKRETPNPKYFHEQTSRHTLVPARVCFPKYCTQQTRMKMIPRMLYWGKKNGVLRRNGRRRQSNLANCGNRAQLSAFPPKEKCWFTSSQESNKMKGTCSYSIFSHRVM